MLPGTGAARRPDPCVTGGICGSFRRLCLLGGVSSVAARDRVHPPSQFGHLHALSYAVLILAGILAIGILPPLLMDRLRRPGWKAASDG
jgi:hypothetical protein